MTVGLPIPNLDDRDFAQLMAEARALIAAKSPEWTDLGPSDPGITLLELFAYLTDTLLYRVNRIPEKALVRFLDLIGVTIMPPAAASVDLEFSLAAPATARVVIPRGSRVTTARSDAGSPIFATTDDAVIEVGETTVVARARAGEIVEGEVLGEGTGRPGQVVRVAHPPIALPAGDVFDLIVGVEAEPDEIQNREAARRLGSATYRIWTEVPHFGAPLGADDDAHLYTVDRTEGVLTFAPAVRGLDPDGGLDAHAAALAEVPASGRRIVAWYRHGGGAHGNVAPRTLTVLKDAVPGVSVVNPRAASGGRDQETLENAMARGPQSIHALDRVVTARDYEQFAVSASGGVSRARAVTRAEAWVGATPGEVQVFVVPTVDSPGEGGPRAEAVEAAMAPHVLEQLEASLHARQPIGTRVRVTWAGLKRMRVVASVVVHRAEDREAITRRLHDRLNRMLSPVPTADHPGWPFGEYLRVARVYDVLQGERGVRYVSEVKLVVEDVPRDVSALERDPHQPDTWFCGSGSQVFRTVDNAAGWVAAASFDGEVVERLAVLPGGPGHVVAVTRPGQAEASVVHASSDYGETWHRLAQFDFHVENLALALVDDAPHAFLATDEGLFRQPLAAGSVADRVTVLTDQPSAGCYAVAAVTQPSGGARIAVAMQELKGVHLSYDGGRSGTFSLTGLAGQDIRVLRVWDVANRRFLYAGAFATGDSEGFGIASVEVLDRAVDAQGWRPVGQKWSGGSCRDIAFVGESVLAATDRAGITVASPTGDGAWRMPTRDCGLPLRESGVFQPLAGVGANVRGSTLALCGGPEGVFRSTDGRSWRNTSPAEFTDEVSLPPNWLFAPGTHEITVEYDHAR